MPRGFMKNTMRAAGCLAASAALLLALTGCAASEDAASLEPGAAAAFRAGQTISEDEVTAYIDLYRMQAGVGEDDAAWAAYLGQQGLTAEALREATIRQLVIDKVVEERARQAGLAADGDEVEVRLDELKNTLAFGDEEIFEETLQLYGRSVDDMRALYEQELTQEALLAQEVPEVEPTEDEVAASTATAYPDGLSSKHVYAFHLESAGEEPSYEELAQAQQALADFQEAGLTAEHFATVVQAYGAEGGDAGYDVDPGTLSAMAQNAVADTEAGATSSVFLDDHGYGFVWVDEVCEVPPATASAGQLAGLPEAMRAFLDEQAAEQLWQEACLAYLNNLYDEAQVEVAPMPTGLSYDVGPTAAQAKEDGSEAAE